MVALLRRERREVGLKQLAHDAERELLLEVGAAGNQHLEAGRGREHAGLGDEPRLAHPGAPLDRHHPSGPGRGGVDDRM